MAFEHLRQKVKAIQETPAGKELFIGEILNQGSYGKGFYDIKYFDTKYENVPIMASSNGLSTGSDIKDGGTVFCGYVNRQPMVLEPGDEYVNGTVVPYIDETDINFYYPWQQLGNEDTYTYSSFYSSKFEDPLDIRIEDRARIINFENMVSAPDLYAAVTSSCKTIPIRRNGVVTYYDCFYTVNDNIAVFFEQKTMARAVWVTNLPKPTQNADSFIYSSTYTANIIPYRSVEYPNVVVLAVRVLKTEANDNFVVMLDFLDTNTGIIYDSKEYYFNEHWYYSFLGTDNGRLKFRCSKISSDGSGCFAVWFQTKNNLHIITQRGLTTVDKTSDNGMRMIYDYDLANENDTYIPFMPFGALNFINTHSDDIKQNIFNLFWDNKIVYCYYQYEDIGGTNLNGYDTDLYRYVNCIYFGYFDIFTNSFFNDIFFKKTEIKRKTNYLIGSNTGFKEGYHKRWGYAPDMNYLLEKGYTTTDRYLEYNSTGVIGGFTVDSNLASKVRSYYCVTDSNCSVSLFLTSNSYTESNPDGSVNHYTTFSLNASVNAVFTIPTFVSFKIKSCFYYEWDEIFSKSVNELRLGSFVKNNDEYFLSLFISEYDVNPIDIQNKNTDNDIIWSISYNIGTLYLLNEIMKVNFEKEIIKSHHNNTYTVSKYNRSWSIYFIGTCIEKSVIDGYEHDKSYIVIQKNYSQNLNENEDYLYPKLKYCSINISDGFSEKVFYESLSAAELLRSQYYLYQSGGQFQNTINWTINGFLFFNNRKMLTMLYEYDYEINGSSINFIRKYRGSSFFDIVTGEIERINLNSIINAATRFGVYNISGYKIKIP